MRKPELGKFRDFAVQNTADQHSVSGSRTGMLRDLLCNRKGNALAIMAAAVFPILGLVGAGLDMGRAYMVKTRLLAACDAGVLAGRRAQRGAAYDTNAKAVANRTFSNNYSTSQYGSFDVTFSTDKLSNGDIQGTARAKISTMIMFVFGKRDFTFDYNCAARLDLPNTDIMFVLDTTGSMVNKNPGDSVNRITAMKNAVTAFHGSLEASKPEAIQVRYGFVPFSSTVNVGALLEKDWIADQWTYQSRELKGGGLLTSGQSVTWSNWTYVSGSSTDSESTIAAESCIKPADEGWTRTIRESGAKQTNLLTSETTQQHTVTSNGTTYSVSLVSGECKLIKTVRVNYVETVDKHITNVATGSNNWTYKPVQYNLGSLTETGLWGLLSNNSVNARINSGGAWRQVKWGGCIEERDTIMTNDASSVPSGAKDLNIDLVPNANDPSTQWRPFLPDVVFPRLWNKYSTPNWTVSSLDSEDPDIANYADDLSSLAACPSPSKKLSEMSVSQVSSYLDTLAPIGQTYYDIGMIWGARLISPTGLFKSENEIAPNGSAIARHIILMTDGEVDAAPVNYTAHGIDMLDRRMLDPSIEPTKAIMDELITARFSSICNDIKSRNITIWVIAFGTDLTSTLRNCASSSRSWEAKNAAELNHAFSEIASQIAGLRVTR